MKRTAVWLAGAVAIAGTVIGVAGVPAFASGGQNDSYPMPHVKFTFDNDANGGTGGTGGAGGDGGVGLNLLSCLINVSGTQICSAGNGGNGGDGNGGGAALLQGR